MTNLPTDLLRTFVTAIDLGGYTRAAEQLGRSQPAVSLQMRRLEKLVGRRLIVQDGREMRLTEDGQALAMIARQMLELNDLAVGRFEPKRSADAVRVGVPIDYGSAKLLRALTLLIQDRPEAVIEIRCDLSAALIQALRADDLDVAVALFDGDELQNLTRRWRDRPVWAAAESASFPPEAPVPLICHQEGCVYRERMTGALAAARREWRIALSSPDIGALQQAVLAGVGVSALTRPTLIEGMRALSARDGFPDLPPLDIGLFHQQARLGAAGELVAEQLTEALNTACGAEAPPEQAAG